MAEEATLLMSQCATGWHLQMRACMVRKNRCPVAILYTLSAALGYTDTRVSLYGNADVSHLLSAFTAGLLCLLHAFSAPFFSSFLFRLLQVREQLHTLTGLAAAFGSLFPNPALSVMMLHELSVASGPLKFPFMESIVYCGIAATTSYCIFFGLESLTFLTPLELPISAYDVIHGKRFRIWYIVAAVPLGLASGTVTWGRSMGGEHAADEDTDDDMYARRNCVYVWSTLLVIDTHLSCATPRASTPSLSPPFPLVLGSNNIHHCGHGTSPLHLRTTPAHNTTFPQRRRPPVTSEGIIGLIGVILLGIFKQLGAKVRTGLNGIGEKCRLPPWFLGTLLTPAVGGTMVAYLAMAAPLILGDGNSQLGAIVKAAVLHNTSGATLDVNTVALTGLAKMAALGISLGFGFIGGQIFPLVFAGACAGAVATMVVPGLPLLVAMPCMMVGVPAAFVPSPFAFTMLVSLMLVLGPEATTPVFVSSFTSYVTSTVVTSCNYALLRSRGIGVCVCAGYC